MCTIKIQNLTKRYGSVLGVDDLSFEAGPGQVTGFLGPNGSGKTTTLRILLGLPTPTAGTGLLRELAAQNRTVFVSSHLLSEVAQTVDEVVVLSRGRLVAQTPLSDLVARTAVVRVRTPDASRLHGVLAAAGLQVRLVDGSTVEARSATADAVGLAASAAGVIILELSRHDEDLESLFFDLVNQNPPNQETAA